MTAKEGSKPTKNKRKFDSSKNDDTNTDSKSPSNKKRALKQSRQSHRPHAEVVISAKELWNKLRVKTNTQKDIEVMMKEMMVLLKGKFNRVALQHDASRVVQASIQFGNNEQRFEIIKELCDAGNIIELAKSQYSHFVVLKMIKYCNKDEKSINLLVKAFKGHICKLAVHSVAARVVELLFANFPTKSTKKLKLEIYGPRFTLFNDSGTLSNTSSHPTLSSIIKDQPAGKEAALESVLSVINKGIDKGLFSFAYFQELLCEYLTVASPSDVRSLCPSLVDHSIHLLSTKAGSRAVAECAAYGTPKDRKRIMKSLKGYTRSSLLHADAYIAILRLLDVTDDTVSAEKSILAELQVLPKEEKVGPPDSDDEDNGDKSPILDIALSETGSKLLLLLLAKDEETRNKYFDPAELEILRPNPTILENGEEVPTSKKNSKTRQSELLQCMKNLLVGLCEMHASELLESRCGAKVLREVHVRFPSKKLSQAIVNAFDDDDLSMFEHPIGHLSIKAILANEKSSSANEKDSFSTAMYEKFQGKLVEKIASSNRGAFILAALAEVETKAKKEVARKEISKLIKLNKAEEKPIAGYEALLKVLDE